VSEFEVPGFEVPGEAGVPAVSAAGVSDAGVSDAGASGAGASAAGTVSSPVMAAMRELDTIADRDLAEHPDVYQRIHTELQTALTTIDDA
jgi:hypothetical protein